MPIVIEHDVSIAGPHHDASATTSATASIPLGAAGTPLRTKIRSSPSARVPRGPLRHSRQPSRHGDDEAVMLQTHADPSYLNFIRAPGILGFQPALNLPGNRRDVRRPLVCETPSANLWCGADMESCRGVARVRRRLRRSAYGSELSDRHGRVAGVAGPGDGERERDRLDHLMAQRFERGFGKLDR